MRDREIRGVQTSIWVKEGMTMTRRMMRVMKVVNDGVMLCCVVLCSVMGWNGMGWDGMGWLGCGVVWCGVM